MISNLFVLAGAVVAAGAVAAYSIEKKRLDRSPPNPSPPGCPPNVAGPPVGYKPYKGVVTSEMTAFAVSALVHDLGTWLPMNDHMGVLLEYHYHPPGGTMKPWGCHKGATLYRSV